MSWVGAAPPEGVRRTAYAGLAAWETGRGPTVLLVPGFSGSKEDFGPLLPHLSAAGWRCVAVDQRGQYESPGPDDPSAYAVDALAADLLAVVDELGEPVHLVGHSFGGLVARAAALRSPGALRSLVLLGSGPAALTGPRVEVLRFLPEVLAAGGTAAVADASEQLSALDPDAPVVPQEVRTFLRERWTRSSGTGMVAMAAALTSEPDRVEALRATGLPVLVAHGVDDDAWLPPVQREMAERLGAAYAVVPGARHSPAAEAPSGTAAELVAFWGGL